MFEQFLVDLLNKILGDYVDNLQTNQLNLGVWSGDVVLRDLRLRKDALDKFQLPVMVREGYLGDLRLSIPWSNLKNQAVKISITDIFLLVGSAGADFYDEEKEQVREWRLKMERLETAELVQQQQVQIVQNDAQNSGFFESLVTKIIDNLQIHVQNVHIRYEDTSSHPGHSVALGLTMSGLTAVSTDENWLESFIQQTRSCIYKSAQLNQLSVYWNVGASTIVQSSLDETIKSFRSQIPSETNRLPEGFQYLIHPITGKAKLILNKHQTHDRPRVNIDLIFDDFSVTVEELQYHSIHYLVNEFSKMSKLKEFHKHRPAKGVTVKQDPRAYWKFAIESIRQPIHDRLHKWTWAYFKERRRLRKTYVRLWKYKRRGIITKDDTKSLQDLEKELSVEDIRFFRSIADIQLKKESPKAAAVVKPEEPPKQEQAGWLSGWWYGSSTSSSAKLPQISEEQRKLLYETIDFHETDVFQDAEVADSDISLKLNFVLGSGSFALTKSTKRMFDFSVTQLNVETTTRKLSWGMKVSLTDLALMEALSENTLYPYLIRSKDHKKSISSESLSNAFVDAKESIEFRPDNVFFNMQYEINPIDSNADHFLSLQMKPLEVVYVKDTISKLTKFLEPPFASTALEDLISAAGTEFTAGLKTVTKAGLQFALEEHRTLDLVVDVEAPIFIFPESITDVTSYVTIFDLGHLKISSDYVSKKKKQEISQSLTSLNTSQMESLMYDKFIVNLEELQIMIGRSCKDTIRAAISESRNHDVFLLPKTDLKLNFDISILPNACNLTKTKIGGIIPHLQINFSDVKFEVLRKLIKSIAPEPESGYITPATAESEMSLVSEPSVVSLEEKTQILAAINFTVQTLTFTITSNDLPEEQGKPLAFLEVQNSNLDVTYRKFDHSFIFTLSEFALYDERYFSAEKQSSYIFQSVKDRDNAKLIKMEYGHFDYKSPLFAQYENKLKIKVGHGSLQLYLPCLLQLRLFIEKIIPTTGTFDQYVVSAGETVRVKEKSEYIFSLDTLDIKLVDKICIAHVSINDIETSAIVDVDDTIKFAMIAGSIRISDRVQRVSDGKSRFSNEIVRVSEDQRLFDVKYQSFCRQSNSFPGYDSHIQIKGTAVTLNYVDDFLIDALAFYDRLMTILSVTDGQATLDKTSDNTKMRLEIDIDSPVLLLYPDLASPSHLAAYLGHIRLSNEFHNIDELSFLNQIKVDLTKIHIQSFSSAGKRHILHDFNVILDIEMLSGTSLNKHDYPDMNTKIKCSPFELEMTPRQYLLVLDIYEMILDSYFMKSASTVNDNISLKRADSIDRVVNKLTFEIERIQWSILLSQTESLAKFTIEHFYLHNATRSDFSFALNSTIGSVCLYDSRNFDVRFRELIPKFENGGEKSWIGLEYFCDSELNTMLLLNAKPTRIQLVPDLLHDLQNFFTVGYNQSSLSKRISQTLDVAINDNTSVESIASFSYRISLEGFQFWILKDSTNEKSDAMVFSMDQFVLAKERIVSLAVSKIGFYLCEANDPERTALRIIQNFDFTFFVDSTENSSKISTCINIDIPEMIFVRISYHDILTVLEIVNRFSRVMESSETVISKAKQSAIETASSFVRTVAAKNEVNCLEEFEFHCLGAKIVLIDDINSSHIPMFEAVLDPFELRLIDWSSKLLFEGQFNTKVNYFNIENSSWEPIVESFKFALNIIRPANNENIELKFENNEILDITVSQALLKTYTQIHKKWAIASGIEKRKADDPYLIRNETGYPLVIWNHDLSDQALHSIDSGSFIPWKFSEWRRTRDEIMPKRHRICIQLKAAFETVKDVPIDKVRCAVFSLKSSQESFIHKLIVDIHLENNIKIVTIRSACVIENGTSFDVSFQIKDSVTKAELTVTIPASKSYAIPLQFLRNGHFNFKPSHDVGYSWSEKQYHWSDFVQEGRDSFISICRNQDEQISDFICQLCTEIDRKDPSYQTYPHMKIKLLPILKLENLLPFNVKYTLYDKTTKRQFYGNVESGHIEPIHHILPLHIIGMSFKISHDDYGASSIGIINNPVDFLVDDSLSLTFKDGSDLLLKLSYNKSADNCQSISIVSPYLFVNKSGLDLFATPHSILPLQKEKALSLKNIAIFDHSLDIQKAENPVMFSYSKIDVDKVGKILIKSNKSDWSKPFGLDAVGGVVDIQLKNSNGSYTLLCCSTLTGTGKFNATKTVSIFPKFIIVNKVDEELQVKLSRANNHLLLKPNEVLPVTEISSLEQFLMALRFRNVFDEWSSPFVFNDVGKFHVKLTKANANVLLKAEIVLEDNSLFILVSKDDSWPYRIDNNSSVDITVSQLNTLTKYLVKGSQSMVYAWDEPAVNEKLLLLNVMGYKREINLDELGPLMPLSFEHVGIDGIISLEIVSEGLTFVLKIANWSKETSIYERNAIHRRKSASSSKISLSPQEEMFSVVEIAPITWMTISLRLKMIGLSLINYRAREMVYISIKDFEAKLTDTNLHSSVGISIQSLQIDNQSPLVLDPIIFGLTPIETRSDVKVPPILQIAVVKSKDSHYGLDFYRYFTVLLQEVSLQIDEDFLMGLIEFFQFDKETTGQDERIWMDEWRRLKLPNLDSDPNRLYFEVFQLQPVKINMTFSRSETRKFERIPGYGYLNILVYLTNVLTTTIGNVTDAPIRFNALIMEHPVFTAPTMVNLVSKHYTQEFLRQLHRLIGAADFLGNPVGLFNTLGSGVKDVFYEPYLGIVSDRPQDFGIGIAKGASSFLRKTVFGLSDTFSKFTGSVGKGLASATLDSEFQQSRRLDKFRNRPRHAGDGVSAGASSFAKSIMSGFTGIIEQPIKGAEKEGFGGFMKGLGRGIVGAVTKPVVGVFDLASNVTEGLKHSTMSPEALSRRRVRLPRHVGKDGIIKPYDPNTAYGAHILSLVENGIFLSTDIYVIHVELKRMSNSNMEQPDWLIVTDFRIMSIKKPKYDIEWSLLLQDIATVKKESESIVGIYTRVQGVRRLVHCMNPTDTKLLIANIQEALQTFKIEHIGTDTTSSPPS